MPKSPSTRRSRRADNRSDSEVIRVLLVEDTRSIGLLMSSLLQERWNCQVDWAKDLAEAKSRIEHQDHPYLVALCDLNLPDAPNGEIIDLVSEHKIPSVALTGSFGEETREVILAKGVVDYVLKDSINAYTYVCDLVGRLARNRNITILVVDDANSIRMLLKQALEKYGLQVRTAADGEEGLELLKAHSEVKLMIVDNSMPKMDGFSLTIEARKLYNKEQLAIIGISASTTPILSARFLKNGANDFIYKPFHYEEVVSRVNQNLEMLELLEESRNIANLDFLTGIYNRRYFFLEGEKRRGAARSHGDLLAGVMLDIDHFKRVNDTYGHDLGDEVIKAVASLIDTHFSDQLVARLGGEEFALLCVNTAPSKLEQQLNRLREDVAGLTIALNDKSTQVTLSIGLCMDAKEHENLDALMAQADLCLYQAKESGRNRVVSDTA